MAGKKVAFIVASEGFQPVEYAVPKKLLEQAGITVETASNKNIPAIAKDGSTTHVDYLVKDIPLEDLDGVFVVGGPGAMEHLNNKELYAVLDNAIKLKKIVGAICVSSRILAQAGILTGRQATGWNGDNELAGVFKEHGVHYKNQDVVRDENIITATGPDASREYGEHIISMLD